MFDKHFANQLPLIDPINVDEQPPNSAEQMTPSGSSKANENLETLPSPEDDINHHIARAQKT